MEHDPTDRVNFLKAISVLAGAGTAKWLESIGVDSWSTLSAMLACGVSVLFFVEWAWKMAYRILKRRFDPTE